MIPPRLRPFLALLPTPLVLGFAQIGPVASWGKAPGTNGTVVGLLFYTVFFHGLSAPLQVMLLVPFVFLAIVVCDEAERRLNQRDPGTVILDEVIAVPLCFLGLNGWILQTGAMWAYMLAGFALFRLFDILKPFGIKKLQQISGGLGVVVDDLAAALATCLTLHAGLWILVAGGWIDLG